MVAPLGPLQMDWNCPSVAAAVVEVVAAAHNQVETAGPLSLAQELPTVVAAAVELEES